MLTSHTSILKIGLVACAAQKRKSASPAGLLYTSDLFRKSREYVLKHTHAWYVLSAAHGVVHPATILEPYNTTLNTMSQFEVRKWAGRTTQMLSALIKQITANTQQNQPQIELVLLTGERYASFCSQFRLMHPDVIITKPLQGLPIGKRLQYLKRANASTIALRGYGGDADVVKLRQSKGVDPVAVAATRAQETP